MAELKQEDLIPPDASRCQALRANKSWSPFNLGPADIDPNTGEKRGGSRHQDRYWRCNEKPVCVVEEVEPADDGLQGSMSLCADCYVDCCNQMGHRIKLVQVFPKRLRPWV